MEQTVTEEHADESGFSVEGEAINLATHGAGQEPPVSEETKNQRRCPGCGRDRFAPCREHVPTVFTHFVLQAVLRN